MFFIISDSGRIQEEAPALGKPTLVTRKTTERPEALKTGTVKLVRTNKKTIFNEEQMLLTDEKYYNKMSKLSYTYGDGSAWAKISAKILNYFNLMHFEF